MPHRNAASAAFAFAPINRNTSEVTCQEPIEHSLARRSKSLKIEQHRLSHMFVCASGVLAVFEELRQKKMRLGCWRQFENSLVGHTGPHHSTQFSLAVGNTFKCNCQP